MKKIIIRIVIALIIGSGFLMVESKFVQDKNNYEYIQIYFSSAMIEENETIKNHQIKKVTIPKRYVYGNYLERDEMIIGHVAKSDIEPETMISPFMLEKGYESYPIEPNSEDKRLITIRFDEEHSNGFMIRKDQVVDLVYTSEEESNQSCMRIENIKIREILSEDLSSFIGIEDKGNHGYIYVCFEVSMAIDDFLIKELSHGSVNISIRKNQ